MDNAIFDEAKGVYRVNHSDGSFDTYTPAQYREFFGSLPVAEEEEGDADIVIDATPVVLTQDDIDAHPVLAEHGLKVGDVGTVQDDSVDFSGNTSTEEIVVTSEANTQE